MKKISFLILVDLFGVGSAKTVNATTDYLTYSGYIATLSRPDLAGESCKIGSYGIVHDSSYASNCLLYVKIDIPEGATLKSVNVYYYDNSGSQLISVALRRTSLSSDSYYNLATKTDTTTSSSVQYATLTYDGTTSSSYSYSVLVNLGFDAEYRGLQVTYEY